MTETLAIEPEFEWDTPLYRQALAQFDQALPYADASAAVVERMRFPERAVMVSIPVRLDSGEYRVFAGYRVQHSTVLGPTKGGMRYDAERDARRVRGARDVDDVEVRAAPPALRRREGRRALHTARSLSQDELQRITRRFTTELVDIIGPQSDIPAPDMATNEQTMAWMMDTYSMQRGFAVPEIVTGKPISIGGSVFRHEATGVGVVMIIERACERLGWRLSEQRCVVQGFGNVGGVAAMRSRGAGARR